MTTTYGGTTITARTHLPINTRPIRIPGRPAPNLSPDRWSIRSPWADMTIDPAQERAALTKIATAQKKTKRGTGRTNASHLAALNAGQRAARDTRIRNVPPDQWSDRPIYISAERAQLARTLADTVAAGASLAAAADTHGVSFGTAEKWLARGWTTTPPDGNRPALGFATPPDQTVLAALARATHLIADGMGRGEAAKAAGVSIRRLREHLGTPDTGKDERVAHAARLVAQGMSRENAARTAGCTRNSLRAHLGPATGSTTA